MLRKSGYCCLAYTPILFALLFFTITVAAQQKGSSQKNPSPKTIYLHLSGHSDTLFQSTGTAIRYGITPLYNNLPSKLNLSSSISLDKPQKKYSIEGVITVTVDTKSARCGHSNGSIIVSATGGTPPYIFSIAISGHTYTQNTGNFQNLPTGGYQVTVTDANGRTASTSAIVQNFSGPSVSILSHQFPTGCTSFDGAIILSASGGVPPYLYSLDDISYQTSNVFPNLARGVYDIFVKDANNCISEPSFDFLIDTSNHSCFESGFESSQYACNNGWIFISPGTSGTAPYQYSLNGINYQSDNNFYNLGAGFHFVYIRDATGFVSVFALTMFAFCPLNISVVTVDATCGENDGKITATSRYGIEPYTYSLDGVNFQNSNVFRGLAPGNYTITVRDTDGTNAVSTVITEKNCACKFYVPTAFTPGNDGKNDIFRPSSYQCRFSKYEIKLYNRFGQLIFASQNPAIGWDGTFKNVQQPTGIYVYELSYTDNLTGKSAHIKGFVTLLR